MIRLFLIRHGETVDNVAQLYAGRRDSELTNHGFHQGTLLGQWMAKNDIHPSHIFSSTLKRAQKTAQLVADAQRTKGNAAEVTCLGLLQEQDYGSYEGQPFSARSLERKAGHESHQTPGSDDSSFVDVESKESMAKRADEFIDDYLINLCVSAEAGDEPVVAVVAHGIILSVLWKRFLQRLDKNSVSLAPDLQGLKAPVSLEHLGTFSNTGYLELVLSKSESASCSDAPKDAEATEKRSATGSPTTRPVLAQKDDEADAREPHNSDCSPKGRHATSPRTTGTVPASLPALHGWTTVIKAINCKVHLQGLKRTGRGVGSAKHDETQKTMDSFFKRQKRE
ncbi:histidine phosphatase superfamily [Phyllosticta capitalensis]|uniref:Histidine phosphatase superfamily n=1 Tax=Phyllosticta capitalensis TaxID=121624 RepID=A0ABR1Z502_9PEZI